MAQVTIFAYSDNKFHATLSTRAQNSISAPTCVPETRFFWALKFAGGILGNICQIPGVLSDYNNTRPYTKGKFPTSVNCLSGKLPGGGLLLQELTHALISCANFKRKYVSVLWKFHGKGSKKGVPQPEGQLKSV
jgi:hypothetical protein